MCLRTCAQYFRQQKRLNKQGQNSDIDDNLLPRGLDDHPRRGSRGRSKEGDPEREMMVYTASTTPKAMYTQETLLRLALRAHNRQEEQEVRRDEDHKRGINAEIMQPRGQVLRH